MRKLRRYVPYTLSEPEERLLNERDATARKAWQTLFNRHLSTLAVDFDSGSGSEPHNVSRLASLLSYPDRDLRRRANARLDFVRRGQRSAAPAPVTVPPC